MIKTLSVSVVLFVVCISICSMLPMANAACSSCLVSSVAGAAGVGVGVSDGSMNTNSVHHRMKIGNRHKSAILYLTASRISTHFGMSIVRRYEEESKRDENDEKMSRAQKEFDEIMKAGKDADEKRKQNQSKATAKKPVSAGMVGAIGVYKNFISPLLPPACRFLPTCSQYGVQAIEEFGPEKGLILTAWRLMRCTPFGGKGYDPPKWPPVAYNYGSY